MTYLALRYSGASRTLVSRILVSRDSRRDGECEAECDGECEAECDGECAAECEAECDGECEAECEADLADEPVVGAKVWAGVVVAFGV